MKTIEPTTRSFFRGRTKHRLGMAGVLAASILTQGGACMPGSPRGAFELFVWRTEADRVAVRVRDRRQQTDRTLAVDGRHDRHDDFIARLEGIRTVFQTKPRDLLDAAAKERPLCDRA